MRRFLAIVYDAFLLLAVLFFATAIILPFNAGEALHDWQIVLYRIYLVCVSFLFYGWFWTHGGQTLGMRAWKFKVQTRDRQAISWKQAVVRFCSAIISWACFGVGFLWALIDSQQRSWHDILSGTSLYLTDK